MPDEKNDALFDAVCGAFGTAGWAYRTVDGRADVIEAEFEAFHTKVCLHVQVFAEPGVVSVVAEAAMPKKDQAFLGKAAELLMRANQQLNLGAFETDYEEAKVYFRLSNVFPLGNYDEEIIGSLVHTVVVEMDRITPFLSVLGKDKDVDVVKLLAREDLLPQT